MHSKLGEGHVGNNGNSSELKCRHDFIHGLNEAAAASLQTRDSLKETFAKVVDPEANRNNKQSIFLTGDSNREPYRQRMGDLVGRLDSHLQVLACHMCQVKTWFIFPEKGMVINPFIRRDVYIIVCIYIYTYIHIYIYVYIYTRMYICIYRHVIRIYIYMSYYTHHKDSHHDGVDDDTPYVVF